MDKDVCKGDYNVVQTELTAGFWLGHKVSEAHMPVSHKENCALVHYLHLDGKGRLERPKPQEVLDYEDGGHGLNGQLAPQEVFKVDYAPDEEQASCEEEHRVR